MKAQFRSKCPACEATIEVDDEIKRDGEQWVHADCDSADMTEQRPSRFGVESLDWSD